MCVMEKQADQFSKAQIKFINETKQKTKPTRVKPKTLAQRLVTEPTRVLLSAHEAVLN